MMAAGKACPSPSQRSEYRAGSETVLDTVLFIADSRCDARHAMRPGRTKELTKLLFAPARQAPGRLNRTR
jgi:hypothetical protein